jgi:hypothetical protein
MEAELWKRIAVVVKLHRTLISLQGIRQGFSQMSENLRRIAARFGLDKSM